MTLSCDHVVTANNNLLVNGGFDGCKDTGNTCPDSSWVFDQGTSDSPFGEGNTVFKSGARCRSNQICAQISCILKYAGFKQTVLNLIIGSQYILKFWVTSWNQRPFYGIQIMIDGVCKYNITTFYTGEVSEL